MFDDMYTEEDVLTLKVVHRLVVCGSACHAEGPVHSTECMLVQRRRVLC